MHLWVILPAIAMAVVCAVALVWGDRGLRLCGAVIGIAWSVGLVSRVVSHTYVGTAPIEPSDLIASLALLAIWLGSGVERLDLFVIAALQGLQCLLELSKVEIRGQVSHAYYVEYNALNLIMLAALLGATVAHQVRRGRLNAPQRTLTVNTTRDGDG